MTQRHEAIKKAIKKALQSLATGDLPKASTELFRILGYRSERVLEGQRGNVEDFIRQFPAPKQETESEESFRKNTTTVHILFQVTDEEIADSDQGALFDAKQFDKVLNKSYLFLVVQLKELSYSRTHYAGFTREINKRFSMPAFVLFRTGQGQQSKVTLAFIQRRKHKRDEQRHVLGSVSLIRDIDPHQPHRAHLDILAELSLPKQMEWMASHNKLANFDGLLAALLNTLDTQELNKSFYKDLFGWFSRAVEVAKVPTDQARMIPKEEHIIIRLITRLLFVWFIKEKGLVAEDLFIEKRVRSLLKNYDLVRGDSYYRAVLQNLFFATLNTEIHKRGFSTTTQCTHRDFSRYRYKDEMADPESLLELFRKTPFINGGLFDCLDSFESTSNGGYRIDCFSDNPGHRNLLSIPNHLFFDDDGLVTILNRYKFTVEENTPIEQDVALDPELLGKVFENLLAAVNPETRETARKQTGSYYTPRLVVDYMVEEALVASLASKVQPVEGDAKFLRDRLHYLLDYEDAFDDAKDLLEDGEAQQIVQAIAEIKVLDPAVGSGAFPMGILHKLTLALQRLDPHNTRWQALQKHMAQTRAAAAFNTSDQQNRDAELHDISTTFERYRGSDFGRKLYLIQNSIFGVDIQTIACQIAKLRFFISLAIEQQPNHNPDDNYGIKPLPNLETRFVAANTLLALAGGEQEVISSSHTQDLEKQLRANRERYFHAKTRDLKLNCQTKDRELRDNLTMELKTIGMGKVDAEKIAAWDPYDQNTSTDWFDAGYMFGVTDGFDVVIGNPPYVRADSGGDQHLELRQKIEDSNLYETLWEKWDLYVAFIERGYKLLATRGFTTMIVSDAYCHSKYAQKSQKWFLKNSQILRLDFLSRIQIFDAAVRNIIYLFQKTDGSHHKPQRRMHESEFGVVELLPTNEQRNLTYRAFSPEDTSVQQFSVPTVTLNEVCYITSGMVVHAHEEKARGEFELRDLVSNTRDAHHPKPFVEGKHLTRWLAATNKWLEWGTERAPSLFRRPTFPELYDVDAKILIMRITGQETRVCLDEKKLFCNHTLIICVPWHSLSGINNRSIKKSSRYRNEKIKQSDLPPRETLEESSLKFDIKFLIGVMNSSPANNFLKSVRRSNTDLYPDDWKKLPIPNVTLEQQAPIIKLVNQILEAKRADLSTDVSVLEATIDHLVYQLYGLTNEEIVVVERSSPNLRGQTP